MSRSAAASACSCCPARSSGCASPSATHFVKTVWPRVQAHIDLLGLDAGELLEREGA